MKRLVFLLVLAALAYAALPYWSAYSLAQALNAADAEALEPKVAWDELRADLADDVEQAVSAQVEKATGGNPLGKLLAGAVAPNLVDGAVDAAINPETISTVIKRARDIQAELAGVNTGSDAGSEEDGEEAAPLADIRYAFFDDVNTFRVSLAPAESDSATDLIFERRGVSWPLVRMNLPDNALSGLTD